MMSPWRSGQSIVWQGALLIFVPFSVGSSGYRIRYHEPVAAVGKTLLRLRKNQQGWRIEELQKVAAENGVDWRRPGRGGSHVIFSAAGVREIVSVPAKRPIKPVYIKQFLALIDAAAKARKYEHKEESQS